ncbi:MAG: hypothetical protein Q9181_001100 [Wetmoreana brouardii]
MNTIRSTWIGWGTLIVGNLARQCSRSATDPCLQAGGGAYYFAKRSINADKQARHEADMKRRRLTQSLDSGTTQPVSKEHRKRPDHAGSPSTEASHDPAPTSHTPVTGSSKAQEPSKYEAAVPYRARRGDRFS